jgi:probable rRNA maturation factor
MQVSVRNIQRKHSVDTSHIEKVLQGVMQEMGVEEGELSVALVSPLKIKELNSRFRGVDSPTDVLSFLLDEKPLSGEIIISPEIAFRQAKKMGHSFEREMTLLLIHGALHLLGYDHEEEAERSEMEKLQNELLNKFMREKSE